MFQIVFFGGKPTSKRAVVRYTDCIYAYVGKVGETVRSNPDNYVYLHGKNEDETEDDYRLRVKLDFEQAFPGFPESLEVGKPECAAKFERAETALKYPDPKRFKKYLPRLEKQEPLR